MEVENISKESVKKVVMFKAKLKKAYRETRNKKINTRMLHEEQVKKHIKESINKHFEKIEQRNGSDIEVEMDDKLKSLNSRDREG